MVQFLLNTIRDLFWSSLSPVPRLNSLRVLLQQHPTSDTKFCLSLAWLVYRMP